MELSFEVETTRPTVRVIKRDRERERHIANHKDSLLHLLIAENPERAKVIIDKILLTKRELRV